MNTSNLRGFAIALISLNTACGSIPQAKYESFEFPSNLAFVNKINRPFQSLGWVRAKVNFQSLDPNHEELALCRNYYHKAIRQLVDMAKKKGADAVVEVKSIVFLEDGRREAYPTPECSDDGFEGQILVQGIAVQWQKENDPQKSLTQTLLPTNSPR